MFETKIPSLRKKAWGVSCTRSGGVNIILPRSLSTLEIRAKLVEIGLARGSMHWEGDHVRLVVEPKYSRGLTKEVVTRISAW